MRLEKYSFGVGDRFGCQGKAQLKAVMMAQEKGINIIPVWNKSNREHTTIGTEPADTRHEADTAVKELAWDKSYHVDADHINLSNVDKYIEYSDFFTIDVADYIGKPADQSEKDTFLKNNAQFLGKLEIPGIDVAFEITDVMLNDIADKYLYAVINAQKIYNHIKKNKGNDGFIAEVSMDEVEQPQTPIELFFILSACAQYGIPAQTIAPKFTGRFNKGVDYAGDVDQFAKEFEDDLLVIDYAIKKFNLPSNLKLSVHSGSDKFAIYPVMGELIKKYDKGIHVKTAGTTWLEEMIGLALSGGEALDLAKSIYRKAYERREELCTPYSTVIDIKDQNLPSPDEVNGWEGEKFASVLRHVPGHAEYNADFRQLIHVGYKVAAEYCEVYTSMINSNESVVSKQVIENIYERHICRLFNL
jgi:hypothetical protein